MKREITSIDVGEWIRNKRKEKKMLQRDLAAKAHCHETSIGRWERGEDSPTLDMMEQIAKVLGAELILREKGYEE